MLKTDGEDPIAHRSYSYNQPYLHFCVLQPKLLQSRASVPSTVVSAQKLKRVCLKPFKMGLSKLIVASGPLYCVAHRGWVCTVHSYTVTDDVTNRAKQHRHVL